MKEIETRIFLFVFVNTLFIIYIIVIFGFKINIIYPKSIGISRCKMGTNGVNMTAGGS